jgi:hypothetical protein
MREIEQFYSTQIEEMPMNVAGKHSEIPVNVETFANILDRSHLSGCPLLRSSHRLPIPAKFWWRISVEAVIF